MNFSFITVFNPSKTFTIDYINVFANVLKKYHPDKHIYCFSNSMEIQKWPKNITKLPLQYTWSTDWWSKLELFRPDIKENLFYLDLDNLIVQPLDVLFEQLSEDMPLMIKDLDPKKERLQSAVMWIPHSKKHLVWNPFIKMPEQWIKKAGKFGDAEIIRKWWNRDNKTCDTFQNVYGPEHIISYRFHWQKNLYRKTTKIVCFHGPKGKPHLIKDDLCQTHFYKNNKIIK